MHCIWKFNKLYSTKDNVTFKIFIWSFSIILMKLNILLINHLVLKIYFDRFTKLKLLIVLSETTCYMEKLLWVSAAFIDSNLILGTSVDDSQTKTQTLQFFFIHTKIFKLDIFKYILQYKYKNMKLSDEKFHQIQLI